MKKILFLLSVVICLASCDFESVIATNQSMFCNIVNGQLQNDEGILFNVAETECGNDWIKYERIFINCDILNINDLYSFNIRLNDFYPAVSSTPIPSTVDGPAIGNDPVLISGLNLTNSLILNAFVNVSTLKGSERSHLINLMYDVEKSNSDTLFFQFRHNGYGESYGEGKNLEDYEVSSLYYSFDLSKTIPEDAESFTLSVSWDWYKMDDKGQIVSTETEKTTVIGEF